MRNKLLACALTAGLTAGLAVATGAPAAADPTFGCEYPRVCLYRTTADWLARKPTATYRVITEDWQMLSARNRHPYAVYNSRYDDAVWLLNPGGVVDCVKPRETWFHDEFDPPARITGVNIVNDPDCHGA